jgi:hypothetical protein
MRVLRLTGLGTTLLVAGCASSAIEERMPAYVGQPVSVLIDKMGFPTEQREVAGHKVYIWSTSNLFEGTNYRCRIRAILDDHDAVTDWDSEGNGCSRLASKLWYGRS